MKFYLLSSFFFITTFSLWGQCGNLYIGGVFDGPLTGGTPKAIQVCASGDVADLSIYGIGVANNGGGSDGQEYTFPAESVSNGDCFWVVHEGSNPGSFTAWFGFAPCYINNISNINGDDPIEIFCSGSLEDEFGDVALDGSGECWEYQDGWAVNNLGAPNFGVFSCSDWTFSGPNALDGESSNSTAATPYPSPNQTCPAPLPVTLSSFEARLNDKTVELSWTTVLEINNDHFEILRSSDGVNFDPIGRVEGNGNSTRVIDYTFDDSNPKSGLNYYKLKQVDLDNSFEYSFVVKVQNHTSRVKIYPTSIVNTINIELEESELAQLTIVNSTGQVFKVAQLNATQNAVDISELPGGIYYAKIETDDQLIVEKIFKH